MAGVCRPDHAHRARPDRAWCAAWRPRRHRRRPLAGMVAGRLRRPMPRRHQLRPLSHQCARRGRIRASSCRGVSAYCRGPGACRQGAADARSMPALRKLVVIDDSNMFGYEHAALLSLRELIELGNGVSEDDFVRRRHAVRPDDPATIVYTSGTSAHPKGALYTHRALITLGKQFHAFPEFDGFRDIRSVVHLPLNHLYERANTPQGMLVKGIIPHFSDEAERFLETLYEVAPQHHASVPRYWSKLASRVIVGIENSSFLKRVTYRAAMKVGQAYRRRCWTGTRPVLLGALYGLARLIVFDRMLKKLGLHRVRLALSSGAPLPEEVQALWQIW